MSLRQSIADLFRVQVPVDVASPSVAPSPALLHADSIAWSEPSAYLQISKYNPDDLIGRKGFSIYKNMMIDEQVKAAVMFKRATITGREFFFELDHEKCGLPEEEAHRRVAIYDAMLNECYVGPFTDGLNAVEKSIWQGFSMTEQIFGDFLYEGFTYWGLRELKPKPFDTFFPVVNEFGVVRYWEQRGRSRSAPIRLDPRKFVYHRHNPDMDEHYGMSDLRSAYRAYVSKDITIKYMNVFVERLAGGFPVVKPAEGATIERDSQTWRDLVRVLSNITGKSSIILPTGVELELVQSNGSQVDVFIQCLETHDLAIAKSLLVPNLLGVSHTGQTGAYAQSETQFNVFMIVSDDEAARLEDTLNEQVFKPLGHVNFADGIAPKFRFKPVDKRKRTQILTVWKDLLAAGAVVATDTDSDHIRKLLDFPEAGEPIAPPTPAALPVDDRGPNGEMPEAGRGDRMPVGHDDDDDDDEHAPEERRREAHRRAAYRAAFAKAQARVAMAVIDKQSEDQVAAFVPQVELALSEVVADILADIEENNLGSDPSTLARIATLGADGMKLRPVNTQIGRALRAGFNIGEDHAMRELEKAKKGEFSELSKKISMARLGTMAQAYIKAKSFTIAGDINAAVVREIKGVLMNAAKYTWTQRDIKRNIYKTLVSKGLLSGETAREALGMDDLGALAEELQLQGNLAPYRLDTVIRTNLFEAINEARFDAFTDPELDGFVRALEYSAILDSRTTPICRNLDGRVYPVDSPVWEKYRPPNHFNCRSLLIPVTMIDDDVEITKNQPSVEPQDGFGSV